jgi:hypothetical protein
MSGTVNPSWSKAKYAARGIHLDQDTAGRLLEDMGDHIRREMIVRTDRSDRTRLIDQLPSYTNNLRCFSSEVIRFQEQFTVAWFLTMTSSRNWVWVISAFSLACTSAHGPATPVSKPLPEESRPSRTATADSGSRKAWSFAYTPGPQTYRVKREGEVQQADSIVARNEVSDNTTQETLTFDVGTQGIAITAIVDSSTPARQEHAQDQQNRPPVHVSAVLADNRLSISDTESNADLCTPVKSVLTTDLQNLVIPFPEQLSPGLSWKDSVDIKGCQTGIPTQTHITRSFTVGEQISYGGYQVLAITRTDSAQITGEGGLEQHHVVLHAAGTGTGTYYLSVNTGHIVRLTLDQLLDISVVTSSSTAQFQQRSRQEFILAP